MTIKYNLDDKYTVYCDKCSNEIDDLVYTKNGNVINLISRVQRTKQHFHEECYP